MRYLITRPLDYAEDACQLRLVCFCLVLITHSPSPLHILFYKVKIEPHSIFQCPLVHIEFAVMVRIADAFFLVTNADKGVTALEFLEITAEIIGPHYFSNSITLSAPKTDSADKRA